jgi:hypothetical protein
MTRASAPGAWRVPRCSCRVRCVRLREIVPTHPNGSARSGSPPRSDREPAISRFAPRTRHAVPRPTVCFQSGAGTACPRRSCRELAPRSYRERRCVSASRPRSAPSFWPDRRSPAAHGSSKKPGLWKGRRSGTRPTSCKPRSRHIAGCRGNWRAARRRAHAPGRARNCKPPPADRRRPMADHRARWPRSCPFWSVRGPDRAPERPSHRRISGPRPASSHAAASPPGRPRPPRSPGRLASLAFPFRLPTLRVGCLRHRLKARTIKWSDRG